jgi:hypothetical protein
MFPDHGCWHDIDLQAFAGSKESMGQEVNHFDTKKVFSQEMFK